MAAAMSVDFVFFGGTGDLAMRKLLPALYNRIRDKDLDGSGRIIGLAREELTRDEYVARVEAKVREHVAPERYDDGFFAEFARRVHYFKLDARKGDDFRALAEFLKTSEADLRIFYLSTAQDVFAPIAANLASAGLAHERSRIVMEKPIGRDIASARAINDAVGKVFSEAQIYRIDHYLGKEPVQNLLALRFGNVLFEPLWNRTWIRDVQITIAEQLGVESRGDFYDRTGALRDMVQSHLLQLVCITAMEPPSTTDPDTIRDEKLKILHALAPFEPGSLSDKIVRGQYRGGAVGGKLVPGYLEEPGIPPGSRNETFVAVRADIENWRWSGVPFFLRTGKRLPERMAEIVVNFRAVPHWIFPETVGGMQCDRLVIELQPDEALRLYLMVKMPGGRMQLAQARLDLDFSEQFTSLPMDAYERLLMDVVRGQLHLFVRRDEVDAAWSWLEPVLRGWEFDGQVPKPYTSGTWGPVASSALLAKAGSAWREES